MQSLRARVSVAAKSSFLVSKATPWTAGIRSVMSRSTGGIQGMAIFASGPPGWHQERSFTQLAAAPAPYCFALAGPAGARKPTPVQRFLATAARDPEKPKRPPAPWFRFLAHFRSQHADLKKAAVQVAAEQWKALSPEDKRPFEEPFLQEHKAYAAQMEEYKASGKQEAWKRDTAKPKRPQTAFFLFLQDFRASNQHLKLTEVAVLGGEAWKDLLPEGRAPYEQRYAAAKDIYAEEMKEYKESGKEEAWKAKKSVDKEATPKVVKDLARLGRQYSEAQAQLAKLKEIHQALKAKLRAKALQANVKVSAARAALAKVKVAKLIAPKKAAAALATGKALAATRAKVAKAAVTAKASVPKTPATKAKGAKSAAAAEAKSATK